MEEEDNNFLMQCNLYPHVNKALKIQTEDSEGAYLDREDIEKLILVLDRYIKR